MFYNLINNAIKYTNKGSIIVTNYTIGNKAIISICDTGNGISSDILPTIFNRFGGHNTQSDSFGIGLALVKKICDYHKIKISVNSKIGIGTTFDLEFTIDNT